jgi:hypothetical protein
MKCLLCGNKLPKGRNKFCCNKHKDRYHNIHNPRGFCARSKVDYFDLPVNMQDDSHSFEEEEMGIHE